MTDQGGLADIWGWTQTEHENSDRPIPSPEEVLVVLVAHDGATWLPKTVDALASQTLRAGRIIGVDAGSGDESLEILRQAESRGVLDGVVVDSAAAGFGAAVSAALPSSLPPWLWLLHDDSEPRPEALAELLVGTARTGAEVLYPKLLQPKRRNYPDIVAEIGQSISATGARVLTVEPGDIDQSQANAEPVLGGSTAGMLIRSQLWQDLGGLAPELPLHRDGVDFGWRANLTGVVVSTWPDAVLEHHEAGRLGLRSGGDSHEADRLAALRTVAARGTAPTAKWVLTLSSLGRSLGFLVGKSPSTAAAELRALRRFRADPAAVSQLASREPDNPYSAGDLLPGRFWSLRHGVDRFGTNLSERYRDLVVNESDTSIDELTGDDFAGGQSVRSQLVSPLTLLLVGLAVTTLIAARTIFGSGQLAGGGLLPAPASLTQAWQSYLQPNAGIAGQNAPWLGFAAALSTVFFASPRWLAVVALLLVPVLAALSAFRLARKNRLRIGLAAALASAWAGMVIALGLVTAGDVSGMVLAIVLPLLLGSLQQAITHPVPGIDGLRSPAVIGFWLMICAAVWPVMLGFALIGAVICLVRDRGSWSKVAVTLGLPIAYFLPWILVLVRWPGRFLTGVDPLAWPTFPPASWAALVGRIMPSGFPAWLNVVCCGLLGVVLLWAVASIPTRGRRWCVIGAIGLPLIVGAGVSRITLPVPGGDARALLSGWALLAIAGMLAVIGWKLAQPTLRFAKAGQVMLALVGACAAVTFAFFGFQGPVTLSKSELPNYVIDVMDSPRQSRVLMVEVTGPGQLRWNVGSAQNPSWGSGEQEAAAGFATDFANLVQVLSSSEPSPELAQQLGDLGVSHVWVRGFSPDQLAAIGNSPGLSGASADDDTTVWTVTGLVSRAQLTDGSSSEYVGGEAIQAAADERTLVLAEQSDKRWQAAVGETELAQTDEQSPVEFSVPAEAAGDLSYGMPNSWWMLGWQLLILAALALLAAPSMAGQTVARRGADA